MDDVLRATVLLVAAAGPLAEHSRARRWWFLPLAVGAAVFADELTDALDVSHPGARIGAGIVAVALAVWHLTTGPTRPPTAPVGGVAAIALGLSLEGGSGSVVWGALVAAVLVVALPGADGEGRGNRPLHQVLGLVLVVGAVGLILSGIDAV